MKCPKCQIENREPRKFCCECGAKLVQICPQCSSENIPGEKFCGECGQALVEQKATPAVDYSRPQSYTPRFLAEKILSTGKSLEGERKVVTILFADVANYTSMSEKLDPEEVHQIMEGCFQILMDEIHRYEGTIDKFTGDGAIALFGAPVAHEDHAQRACHAALAIQKALKTYGRKVKKDCGMEFKMRIGLNSGPVIVASVGTDLKMDYTAVGDTVNLASRMETAARPGSVLVSENTHKIARHFFKFKSLGKLAVKGKEEPVGSHELLEPTEVATRIEAAVARGLTKFVGRDREMATLREAFDKARSGSGQAVGIVGEAGVGKSRILFELRKMLPEDQHTLLEGRCLHYGGSMPYLPFLDVLRAYFDIEEGDREYLIKKKMTRKVLQLDEKLKEALPPIEDILSLKVEDQAYLKLDAPLKRVKIFEAIRDVLIRESQQKPLVIAVEDLHWIDKTSEEFLGYLIGFLANTPIMVILLYRPEYTHQWGSKSYYHQIGVDQLDLTSSAQLVQSILEEGEVVPELKELILNRTAGNPLFMEEFTHTLLENGAIGKKDHQYVLTRKISEIQIPDTIQGIIAARMDRLAENMKRTMQVASVIGRDFPFRILQTITGMREELKSYLVNLQGLEFIYEKSLFPEPEYVFKHALTQEVAYNSLLIKRRREIHQRIGKAIEEIYNDRLEEFYELLAHHYFMAGLAEKAYKYAKLSGVKAVGNYAMWEALRFFEDAIKVLGELPDTDENRRRHIEVRLLMRDCIAFLGYPADSAQTLFEGERLAAQVGDEKSQAAFYSSIGLYYSLKGDSLQASRFAELAFAKARKTEDVDLAAPIAFDICSSYNIGGEYHKIPEVARQATALIEKTCRESDSFGRGMNVHSVLLGYCGAAEGYLGRFNDGEKLCEKAIGLLLERRDLVGLLMIEHNFGWLFNFKGDGGRAVEHLQNGVKYSEETQMVTLLGLLHSGLAWGYHLLEQPRAAREHGEKSIAAHRDTGMPFLLSSAHSILGLLHFDEGDYEEALRSADEALRLSQTNSEKWAEAIARTLRGRIIGKADRSQFAKAEECILRGLEMFDELRLRPYVSQVHLSLAELYADAGQREKALENLHKGQEMFAEMGMDYWLARTEKALEKLEAQ